MALRLVVFTGNSGYDANLKTGIYFKQVVINFICLGARAGCTQYSAAPKLPFSFASKKCPSLYGVLASIPGAWVRQAFVSVAHFCVNRRSTTYLFHYFKNETSATGIGTGSQYTKPRPHCARGGSFFI